MSMHVSVYMYKCVFVHICIYVVHEYICTCVFVLCVSEGRTGLPSP